RSHMEFHRDPSLGRTATASSVITRLATASPSQAKRAQRYFSDMDQALGEIARVLKHRRHAIIVVCPSHIRKIVVPTQEALVELGRSDDVRLKQSYTRTINERRCILPYLQESFGKRMDTEYVLIFQKGR